MLAPDRIDPKKLGLRSESEGSIISGKDPDYEYEFKSMDPTHPQYVEKYTRPHEIGQPGVGFFTVAAWEVVNSKEDPASQGRKRADDSKGVDTTVRHGKGVLCRLHKSEHQKYAAMDRLKDDATMKMLLPSRTDGSHVSTRGGVVVGSTADGALDASIANITR